MSRVRFGCGTFKCECGKSFSKELSLKYHKNMERKYDKEHPGDYLCPLCKERKRTFGGAKNGYGMFCIKCCRKKTKEAFLIRYGEEDGLRRWEHYCSIQSKTNTFEYKRDKFGWTREQFDEFNKSRSVTLENLKQRHGDADGERIFKDYCDKQAYTNKKEYFIEKYGEEDGKKRYEELNRKKGLTLENFVAKYGEEEGAKRYSSWVETRRKTQRYWSKASKDFFDRLVKMVDFGEDVYYADSEIGIYDKDRNKYSKYDFVDTKNKIIVEFNGHCFHAKCEHDPEFRNWIHPEETSEEAWAKDVYKKELAEKHGYRYFVIWEEDFYADKDKTVANMAKLVKEALYA